MPDDRRREPVAGRTRSSCAILPTEARYRSRDKTARRPADAKRRDPGFNLPLSGQRSFARALSARLAAHGQTLPNDRRYAIENGPSGFDPAAPKWLPKAYFLMLMRNERLAALQTHYDDDASVLTICHDGRDAVQGNLETEQGRAAIERYLSDYCASELKGSPKVLSAPPHSFSDVAKKVVSIKSTCRAGDRRPARATSRSVAGLAQTLCPTVAGLVRVRSPRQGDRHRRRKAPDHEADRALCRYQR